MLYEISNLSKRNFNYAEKVIKKKYKDYIQSIEWDKNTALINIKDNFKNEPNKI